MIQYESSTRLNCEWYLAVKQLKIVTNPIFKKKILNTWRMQTSNKKKMPVRRRRKSLSNTKETERKIQETNYLRKSRVSERAEIHEQQYTIPSILSGYFPSHYSDYVFLLHVAQHVVKIFGILPLQYISRMACYSRIQWIQAVVD